MQQRAKAAPTSAKPPAKPGPETPKRGPIALDQKTLKQIAGGMRGPNGNW
jgi:hypothetical protein